MVRIEMVTLKCQHAIDRLVSTLGKIHSNVHLSYISELRRLGVILVTSY